MLPAHRISSTICICHSIPPPISSRPRKRCGRRSFTTDQQRTRPVTIRRCLKHYRHVDSGAENARSNLAQRRPKPILFCRPCTKSRAAHCRHRRDRRRRNTFLARQREDCQIHEQRADTAEQQRSFWDMESWRRRRPASTRHSAMGDIDRKDHGGRPARNISRARLRIVPTFRFVTARHHAAE